MTTEGLNMLLQQLQKHFPARMPEWINSFIMATWGIYMILHPHMFETEPTRSILAGLVRIQSMWGLEGFPAPAIWGLIAMFVGGIRAAALFINGAYSRTPMIRMASSAVSAFVWTQVVVGLLVTGIPNLGIVVYSWLVIIDIASAYRASVDVALAEKQRKATRTEGRDSDDSSGNSRSNIIGLHGARN